MDKDSVDVNADGEMTSQQKSLTPAVLGLPSGSHGAKLSSNMNSKDKEELLLKLEAWRQARKQKLTKTILAKGKISSSSRVPMTLPKPMVRTLSNPPLRTDAKQSQCDGKKNVFDRLYENASKLAVKKPEKNKCEKSTGTKNVQTLKSSKYLLFGKPKVPKVIWMTDIDDCGSTSNEAPTDATLPVPTIEKGLERQDMVEADDEADNPSSPSNEAPLETNFTILQEHFSERQDTVKADDEADNPSSTSNEAPLETNFTILQEKVSERQVVVEADNEADNLSSTSNEAPLETDLAIMQKISEKRDEIRIGADNVECTSEEHDGATLSGLGEDNVTDMKGDESMNFDVKKSVTFETPKEKILSAVHLRSKLEDWLTENGHSIDSYRHLRCFGLNGQKTPVPFHRQAKTDDLSNSSFYSTAPNTPITEIIDESDKENVTPTVPASKIDIGDVEGWISDLHRLIVHIDYPNDRCEEWLNAITKKFPSCTQLPIYWECVAAMNGNCNGLMSTEQNEELKKREGEDHETSLAELLDKLVIDGKCQSASKTERGLSVKNIFQSKTVKFALQEKAVKELDPELGTEARRKVLVATPVRRSARLQTPDKSNIIGSLQSLDPETRRSVSFQLNEALLTG